MKSSDGGVTWEAARWQRRWNPQTLEEKQIPVSSEASFRVMFVFDGGSLGYAYEKIEIR